MDYKAGSFLSFRFNIKIFLKSFHIRYFCIFNYSTAKNKLKKKIHKKMMLVAFCVLVNSNTYY